VNLWEQTIVLFDEFNKFSIESTLIEYSSYHIF
jgi:hypothetical protein